MIRKSDASNPTIGSRETDESESECRWDAAGWMDAMRWALGLDGGMDDREEDSLFGDNVRSRDSTIGPSPVPRALCSFEGFAGCFASASTSASINHPSMYTGSN
ncbi:uncharacterized protein AKAW2_51197A [Aspergillus luchuensis]|uniref:Uncharacterized protein n=1 Tax=Aspergillus kawachii TaxID=1069201 RepID=A0A7R7X0H8_ASPKA|nr:uncharacterized protein AKAW2_51197A [Aspergillus luchuensis]BCS00856.1 hypothetical protein AKAW2_51197A [Aspergillus luchuensis]BCS12616.1 hypothetical protein ALUC_50662A [Aspergillus luchuensis]